MNQLQNAKLIDQEFLPVYETDKGNKVVIARELHESLMTSTRFNDWIQRNLLAVGFIEGKDFYSFLSKTNGRPATDYILTLDTAKHISMIQRTELGMKIRQKFIDLEKKLIQPKSQLEILQMTVNQLVEQEKRMSFLENQVSETKQEITNISNIVALNPKDWRPEVNKIINSIAFKHSKDKSYRDIRNESYQLLEARAKCDLERRLQNKRKTMALEGASKSQIDKANKMDVIENDKRLTEIYLAIIKEMAIKYQISLSGRAI